ncbi:MAG: hypothetical protein FWC26_12910 [Fibromonadales bacterium]|nr:hypothetical protein [Fibromonadales bacterium]
MNIHKFISKNISILFVLLIGVQTAFAQTAWYGTADSAWYTSDRLAVSYTIYTAEELAGLAELVNGGTTFRNKTITLGANIVLNDTNAQGGWMSWNSGTTSLRQWTPIGNSTNNFKGNFNGNGKVVMGLYISNNLDYQGLFGVAYEGSISNLGLACLYVKGGRHVGGVSGLNAMPTLSCTGLAGTALVGTAINTPTVTCSIGSFANSGWTNAPSWSNLSVGVYSVTVTGTCDGIIGLTASCGTLTVCTNCLIDSRDNKTYKTVVIGTQTWMAENLNYNASGSKCYDNADSNCVKYGRLYNWATAMYIDTTYNSSIYTASAKHKGVCPTGWHIPSNAEWTVLTNYTNYVMPTERT